ncbi:MAG TPA: DUF4230 domain-containing protein, partial [Bacilli bacterium]|nr:DUF4230 domain-containing protein [Bacilli bacterium]
FRSHMTAEEGKDILAATQVKDQLRAEAASQNVLQRAEDNAVSVLQGFYEKLGYTVTIHFQDTP